MVLRNITICLLTLGIICLIAGIILKSKKIKITSFIIIGFIIIFWIGFYIWALYDSFTEYDRRFPEENNTIRAENTVEGNNTINTENTENETEDITSRVLDDDIISICGKISKIENNRIYFYDNQNKNYTLEENENIEFIDGRTGESYDFSDIKEEYYINVSYSQRCFLFKNIRRERIKKRTFN